MILRQLAVCICILVSVTASYAEAEKSLFAGLAMTKAQEASSLPTDSGVFLRGGDDEKWTRFGPTIQFINSIAIDPSNRETIFLACGNGIVRSLDGGATWRMVTGWRESDIAKIAIDPNDGNNIFAASVWGVSVSYDGGGTWTAANKGLLEKYSRTVIIDQRNPKRLLLGTAAGIYESRNRAKSWSRVRSSPELAILRIARSDADLGLWIAGTEGLGVYLSRDDAKSWSPVAPELSTANIYAVAADPKSVDNLAAAGWGTGVWISHDKGKTWSDRSAGLPSPNITSMTFDPNHSGRLWASTFEEGTYYTDDFGENWQDGGLYGAYVFDLGFIPGK